MQQRTRLVCENCVQKLCVSRLEVATKPAKKSSWSITSLLKLAYSVGHIALKIVLFAKLSKKRLPVPRNLVVPHNLQGYT